MAKKKRKTGEKAPSTRNSKAKKELGASCRRGGETLTLKKVPDRFCSPLGYGRSQRGVRDGLRPRVHLQLAATEARGVQCASGAL